MKRLIPIIFALLAFSCDPVIYYEADYEWGCHYREANGKKELIHCCTKYGYDRELLNPIYNPDVKNSWVQVDHCRDCQ